MCERSNLNPPLFIFFNLLITRLGGNLSGWKLFQRHVVINIHHRLFYFMGEAIFFEIIIMIKFVWCSTIYKALSCINSFNPDSSVDGGGRGGYITSFDLFILGVFPQLEL